MVVLFFLPNLFCFYFLGSCVLYALVKRALNSKKLFFVTLLLLCLKFFYFFLLYLLIIFYEFAIMVIVI